MAKADAILYDVSLKFWPTVRALVLIRPTGNSGDFAVSDAIAHTHCDLDCCQAISRQDGKDPPCFP